MQQGRVGRGRSDAAAEAAGHPWLVDVAPLVLDAAWKSRKGPQRSALPPRAAPRPPVGGGLDRDDDDDDAARASA